MTKMILVQKGHVAPRDPHPKLINATGAVGEQEVVNVLGDAIARVLRADPRFDVRVVPGLIPADVQSGKFPVHAFISLHCDGSTDKNRKGWGIGYPSGGINQRLARLLKEEISKFHPSPYIGDNYTSNMSGYYGYSRVPTPGPENLVEHGFSSNPKERAWMIQNATKFATAYRDALARFFGLGQAPVDPGGFVSIQEARDWWTPEKRIYDVLPGPRPKPGWLWDAINELDRRRRDLESE